MYGTIFNLNIKPGHAEELLSILKEETGSKTVRLYRRSRLPEGMVGWFVMNPDDKDEWIGVAIFDSKAAYVSNTNRPEQHESFLRMMEHLETEPTWTDGEYVIGEIT